jgi:hypothetical protein
MPVFLSFDFSDSKITPKFLKMFEDIQKTIKTVFSSNSIFYQILKNYSNLHMPPEGSLIKISKKNIFKLLSNEF